ncbi:MAG: hypothetical protein [Sanya fiers-like virus 39]|nr:MAG: hypothetical protein [Sanya fiers-like virus 39]
MAQQAAITVFDGAATPVSHTLNPVDNKVLKDGTRVALWRENIATLPSQAQVRAELRQRTFPNGTVETRFRVVFPVMESIAGQNSAGYTAAPKVAYEDAYEQVSYAHPRSTPTSRQICAQALKNILNNVSTTVTPVAAGVARDAFVDQFMPT